MKTLLASIAVLLASVVRVEPHTLDEYLQTTRLDVTRQRVVVELALTPGVAVASRVFAAVDRDADGRVSPLEVERYARQVLQDLTLRVDDTGYSLTLTRAVCPTWDEIREGAGTIRVDAAADVGLLVPGRHRIEYENRHQPGIGGYLVNALQPSSDTIAITGQSRDTRQRRIDLEVNVLAASPAPVWWVFAAAGLTGLVLVRRRAVIQNSGRFSPSV